MKGQRDTDILEMKVMLRSQVPQVTGKNFTPPNATKTKLWIIPLPASISFIALFVHADTYRVLLIGIAYFCLQKPNVFTSRPYKLAR